MGGKSNNNVAQEKQDESLARSEMVTESADKGSTS